MAKSEGSPRIIRFGSYEADLRAGELRRRGERVKLQEQPFRVLATLLQHAGDVVTREELQKELWPGNTFVDFDHGLNKAVAKIRQALKDSPSQPRFVETVGRRGYRFIAAVEQQDEPPGAAPLSPPASVYAVAVLPFENVDGEAETEYLSDGITGAIINALSQLSDIRVPARSTAFRYKGATADPRQTGRDLKVQAVLTGRVQQRAGGLLVGAELMDVEHGWQLWGDTYSAPFSDLLGVQEKIASEICAKLQVRVTGADRKRLAKRHTSNSDAYRQYLRGVFYCSRMTPDTIRKGIECFQQAVETDANYALAYSGIADAYCLCAFFNLFPTVEVMPKALEAAVHAVKIDDDLADAHASLACVREAWNWDWAGAEAEFRRALELNPNHATAHRWYADFLTAMGRVEEAAREIDTALQLDSLSLVINNEVGWNYYMAGKWDEAIRQCQQTTEMDPLFAPAYQILGHAQGRAGRHAEAIEALNMALALAGRAPAILASLAYEHGMAGECDEATRLLDELQSAPGYVSRYWPALVHAGLGQTDHAISSLEACYANHDVWLIFLKIEPCFAGIRGDERFQSLLKRVGLG